MCLHCEVMLRSHHRYALQSVYLVGCLMVNDSWDVSFLGNDDEMMSSQHHLAI